jgi:ATP/maltotriose-dependent transcriptional regulator MalT
MTKEERYQYLDVLAVKAKTDASAKEKICRHFKRYIHHLSKARYENWDREDAEQDLWVCFLECLLLYDVSQGVHFPMFVMKKLKWCYLMQCRKKKGEMRTENFEEHMADTAADDNLQLDRALTEKEVQTIIERCPLTNVQRKLLDQRMEGKSWQTIARENHVSQSGVYRHARNIRSIFERNYNFRETFVS